LFEDLWQAAWADSKPLNCGALRVHIYRLRNKLLPYHVRIDTLVNVGYRLITNLSTD
jgi:DNA-binding response OmpR family regulator